MDPKIFDRRRAKKLVYKWFAYPIYNSFYAPELGSMPGFDRVYA